MKLSCSLLGPGSNTSRWAGYSTRNSYEEDDRSFPAHCLDLAVTHPDEPDIPLEIVMRKMTEAFLLIAWTWQ